MLRYQTISPATSFLAMWALLVPLVLVTAGLSSGSADAWVPGPQQIGEFHASLGNTAEDLAPPERQSPGHALGTVFSAIRQHVDRARHDDTSEKSISQARRFLVQVRAILNYSDQLALAQTGSISHLSTSVPPPVHA